MKTEFLLMLLLVVVGIIFIVSSFWIESRFEELATIFRNMGGTLITSGTLIYVASKVQAELSGRVSLEIQEELEARREHLRDLQELLQKNN